MKRKFLIISAFLAALMLLSACDGNKSPGAGTETVTKEETQNNSGTTPETVPETATVVTEFDDGIKLYSNGVLDFGEIIGDDAGTHMMTMFDRVMADKTLHTNVSQVRIGGVLMDVQWIKPSSDAMESTRLVDLKIEKVTANGHTVKIGVELPMYYRIGLFGFGEGLICVKFDANGSVNKNDTMWDTWIFLKDSAFLLKLDQSAVSEYNRKVMTFYKGEDGQLWYKAVPNKYLSEGIIGTELHYCTGRDEICEEKGTITFHGETPVFHTVETKTVLDAFDLDGLYREWHEYARDKDDSFFVGWGMPRTETLDELLTYNKDHYENVKLIGEENE